MKTQNIFVIHGFPFKMVCLLFLGPLSHMLEATRALIFKRNNQIFTHERVSVPSQTKTLNTVYIWPAPLIPIAVVRILQTSIIGKDPSASGNAFIKGIISKSFNKQPHFKVKETVLDLICAHYSKMWTTNWTMKCIFILCHKYTDINLTIELYRLFFDNILMISF